MNGDPVNTSDPDGHRPLCERGEGDCQQIYRDYGHAQEAATRAAAKNYAQAQRQAAALELLSFRLAGRYYQGEYIPDDLLPLVALGLGRYRSAAGEVEEARGVQFVIEAAVTGGLSSARHPLELGELAKELVAHGAIAGTREVLDQLLKQREESDDPAVRPDLRKGILDFRTGGLLDVRKGSPGLYNWKAKHIYKGIFRDPDTEQYGDLYDTMDFAAAYGLQLKFVIDPKVKLDPAFRRVADTYGAQFIVPPAA